MKNKILKSSLRGEHYTTLSLISSSGKIKTSLTKEEWLTPTYQIEKKDLQKLQNHQGKEIWIFLENEYFFSDLRLKD
jgi:hypothetical protein